MFASIKEAIEVIRKGGMVVVVDDEDRENEGDLVMAAQHATPEAVNFMTIHGRGLLCTPLEKHRLTDLAIGPMVTNNTDPKETAFTVSVDHVDCTTGISAPERSLTIRALACPETRAGDFTKPGHIFPLAAREGGVLKRAGHTEAAVDLARLAGLMPAGLICEIMKDDGEMARVPDLFEYCEKHDLLLISIADLITYRLEQESTLKRAAAAKMPTVAGTFDMVGFEDALTGEHHVALVKGDVTTDQPVLVRVHSECLTGDAFGSLRCDCGEQLNEALERIEEEGRGILLYMRQEGRGIGLINKIRAYALQDEGLDTVEANRALGFADDLRDYGTGARMLKALGVKRIRLMTNNPQKIAGLSGYGLEVVGRESIEMNHNEKNAAYLRTKKERMGHMLQIGEEKRHENI